MTGSFQPYVGHIARQLRKGQVVPFLGAGVNLCGRPENQGFERGRYLPSGDELSEILADLWSYPQHEAKDLVKVAQYALMLDGDDRELHKELRDVFAHDYPPTDVHEFLAGLPGVLRQQGQPRYQVIITTNYDDVLERAFDAAGEEYDLLTYAIEDDGGRLLHRIPGGPAVVVESANSYELYPDERTVIVKIHGAVDRTDPEGDRFVITEDDYIDHLAGTSISALVPATLRLKMKEARFLFLGYSLRDWNLRVFLQQLWETTPRSDSWAVQSNVGPFDLSYWAKKNVRLLPGKLEDFVGELRTAVGFEAPVAVEAGR